MRPLLPISIRTNDGIWRRAALHPINKREQNVVRRSIHWACSSLSVPEAHGARASDAVIHARDEEQAVEGVEAAHAEGTCDLVVVALGVSRCD